MFDQQAIDALGQAHTVLIAGCGGGYDVFGGIPLMAELEKEGKTVHLASLSFSALDTLAYAQSIAPHLFRVDASAATESAYCPEAWLSSWALNVRGRDIPVWCFENVGAVQLRRAYSHLIETLQPDTVVLIDGGVDALLRGDETSLGTPSEDFASLAAVSSLTVPRKILACIGFGAEMRDGICHAQVFERIAELTARGGFLGLWPLLPDREVTRLYIDALEYSAKHQRSQRGSHIHKVICASLAGECGGAADDVWPSPLANIYWFFSVDVVAKTNLLLPHIEDAESMWQIAATIEAARKNMTLKTRSAIPL